MALVKMSVRMIENHWLTDDYRHVMRVHFHSRAAFIGTLVAGILAVSVDGRLVGANRGALEQLGLSGAALRMHSLQSLFGTSVGALVDRFRSPMATPMPVRLQDDRSFHLQAHVNWPVWARQAEALLDAVSVTSPQGLPSLAPDPAKTAYDSAAIDAIAVSAQLPHDHPAAGGAAPADAVARRDPQMDTPHHRTLEQLKIDAIRDAVRGADGNIAAAARQLGISRNTIYRKLRWQLRA